MAYHGSPPKPWEINRGSQSAANLRSSADSIQSMQNPPPVPSRPQQQLGMSTLGYRPAYGGYNGGYNGSGYGGYGSSYGLGGYSGIYGNNRLYGSSYQNGYGLPNTAGSFTQQAEESTRQAFQSVESIVRAFTSISGMLESTLGAVYSSFRAVLDVADHLSRVKATFADALSSITIFRFIRYLYRRAMSLLRIHSLDEAWNGGCEATPHSRSQKNSWPILLFVSVVLGGPYLIWKLLAGSSTSSKLSWVNGDGDHVLARAEFDFVTDQEDELNFKAGEMLRLAPKQQQPQHVHGWVIASTDGKRSGLVPANRIKILGMKRGRMNETSPNVLSGHERTNQSSDNPGTSLSQPAVSKSAPESNESEWQKIHSGTTTEGGNG